MNAPHRLGYSNWASPEAYRDIGGNLLRKKIEQRSALNGYNLAAGLVTWVVLGGCVYLIVSGAL